MSLPFLETIGLTAKEAQIYELLLRKGELTGGQIIGELGIKRATVYKSLYALEAKKLIIQEDKDKKIHFKPEPPNRLVELAESQIKIQEQARADVRTLLPDLMSAYILSVERPVVSTFEGVKGLKEIYEDTLREAQPIYAVLTTAEVEPSLFKWLTTVYSKKRSQLNITAKVIASSGTWANQYTNRDEKEKRDTLLVPNDKFPFQHEVDIYGDKVAFINYKKGDALIGVVINHPQIAKTMKAWFDLAWEGALSLKTTSFH
jgi:sugar-specific transcriptional regulator TrmB